MNRNYVTVTLCILVCLSECVVVVDDVDDDDNDIIQK